MYMSKASHLAVPKHQRPPIWTEEAAGFHKRVKRIHDPVKIMVPCAVVEVEFPIPPDRSMQFSSYIEVLNDPLHAEASQRGLQFRDNVDKGPVKVASIDTDRIPSNDTNKPASIDITTHHRSTLDAYQRRRSSMCVEILGMEIRPCDQKSLGERRGGIGRREKGLRTVLRYH
ncbi:hypothetical protein F2Q70_00026073 [Brassica cretica]|uniref:Uncharacterized protein n=1 Tax=Brassica cretica TaxID=69181 RepID=A0A8S9L9P2_BRACR|nr:hypothetical protein F2Q70_00026073 [Brassica cretica]